MERLTLKKLFYRKPATKAERAMFLNFIIPFSIIIIFDVGFDYNILPKLQNFIFLISLITMYFGYYVGRNHDKIELWLSNKFGKKTDTINQITS